MIYLLMRRQVDDTDLEEIHLEEEEEEPFQPTAPAAPPAVKSSAPGNLTMLEPPTLRPAPKPAEGAQAGQRDAGGDTDRADFADADRRRAGQRPVGVGRAETVVGDQF